MDKVKIIVVNQDMLSSKKRLFGNVLYSLFFGIRAKYWMIGGGKDAIKSSSADIYVAWKFLQHPDRCVCYFRKYANGHQGSTIESVGKAFDLLADLFEVPALRPSQEGKTLIKTGYLRDGSYEVERLDTNSKYYFKAMNQPTKLGSFSIPYGKVLDTIRVEEIVEADDGTETLMEDKDFRDWTIIENTLFRGFIDAKTGEIMEHLKSWVYPQVIFTNNLWNKHHWIIKDYIDKYTPADKSKQADFDYLEKYGFDIYWDPDYEGGSGLVVMRNNAMLNPWRDSKKMEQMKKDRPDIYATTFLGFTQDVGKFAFANNIHNLRTDKLPDLKTCWPTSAGIDYAKKRDWYAVVFGATNTKTITGAHQYDTQGWDFDYVYSEFGWNPKTSPERKTDVDLAVGTLENFYRQVKENEWEQKISRSGFAFVLDSGGGTENMYNTFRNEIFTLAAKNPQDAFWINKIVVMLTPGSKNAFGFRREDRVSDDRIYMDYGMLYVNPFFAANTLKGLNRITYDENGKIIDKDMDFVDAHYYRRMVEPINTQLKRKVAMKRQSSNDGWNK